MWVLLLQMTVYKHLWDKFDLYVFLYYCNIRNSVSFYVRSCNIYKHLSWIFFNFFLCLFFNFIRSCLSKRQLTTSLLCVRPFMSRSAKEWFQQRWFKHQFYQLCDFCFDNNFNNRNTNSVAFEHNKEEKRQECRFVII